MDNLPAYTSTGDTIAIKSLQLPHGIVTPDVWGKAKEQPAVVNITLNLQHGFHSAADADRLDDSTIHYGTLAKKIRSSCTPNQNPGDLSHNIENAIVEMAQKSKGKFIVARSVVAVLLPKASMDGEGIRLNNITHFDESGKSLAVDKFFSIESVKIMTLIGVNSYERSQKQPLITSISLHLRPEAETTDSTQTTSLFNLEKLLIIQQTSFETLETLADFTISELRKEMLDSVLPGTKVHLRIEKPRAIAWAEAPVVEIVREVPMTKSERVTEMLSSASGNALELAAGRDGEQTQRLSILKPYSG
ncbi:hypothetical protein DOTSEDRAFT_126479 [Dothistroma septosporum NZE10]|uniref:Dihydroneopterin aldolase/epimerase domain-containing protein n=1 Tax=Dothistroma septosporum (strain NZE10 / CBS 128990) TaxID=675120 RepID=N1PX14_DOTSN|nr:hypothetical protein DOTSEDRAFT_126479 [Dothistroma septosporum NZE10]